MFPASGPWNQRVDKLPVAPASDRIVAAIGADDTMHADFGTSESDKGPYPIPKSVALEGGRASDGDRHALIVDRDSCKL